MSEVSSTKCDERKLQILFITSDKFPPFRPAAKAIFGDEFGLRGHRVDWVLQAEPGSTVHGRVPYHNGMAYVARSYAGATRIQRLLKYVADFANDLRILLLPFTHRYDIVLVKDKYVAALFGWLAAKMRGSRFCFWLAYPHPEANLDAAKQKIARYPRFYWFRGQYQSILLYKFILRRADHIFVQSEQMRKDISEKGIDLARMTPVCGTLNLEDVPYQGSADQVPTGNVALYVGTLIRQRNLDFLIRAFAVVLESCPDAKLVFVGAGDNPQDEYLLHSEIEACQMNPESVSFVGAIPMGEVWQHIAKATVCLSPYFPTFVLNSTSPTKLIEYMAMGRPIVANQHPEQTAVLSESEAGLCVPWDEKLFADAVIHILKDPEEAANMGRKGRAWVERNRTNALAADIVESTLFELMKCSGKHAPGYQDQR